MASLESSCGEKMQELQTHLNSLMSKVYNNSKVVAFMNSPAGQYLDDHPFVSLSLLVFVVLSVIPVGLFLAVIAGTAVAACFAVIILEGIVIVVGGISLLCVLCGLVVLSLGVSVVLSIIYFTISSILNYMHMARLSQKNPPSWSQSQTEEVQSSMKTSKDTLPEDKSLLTQCG